MKVTLLGCLWKQKTLAVWRERAIPGRTTSICKCSQRGNSPILMLFAYKLFCCIQQLFWIKGMHGGPLVGETKWSVENCPWRHVENPSCLCWFTPDLSPRIFPSTHPLPPTHSSIHLPTQLLIQLSFAHPASEQFPMPTMCRPLHQVLLIKQCSTFWGVAPGV